MSKDIGYGKPPTRSQFVKGQSGNPAGRPKRAPTFEEDFIDECQKTISVTENDGRTNQVSKQRAVVKLIFQSALANEKAGISALLNCMRMFGTHQPEVHSNAGTADIEDLDALKDYVRRSELERNKSQEQD